MEFTFNVTVEIYEDDIDEIVEMVKNGTDIDEAIEDVIAGYDDFEWGCLGYYREDLKKEVKRRLEK